MKISIFPPLSIHEIGQRPNQEDSLAQWDNRLFVLCDGMGGHEKGEVASQTVCMSLAKWFEQNIHDDSFTDDQLRNALEYAYTELDKFDDGSPRKMGTTLTLLYIHARGITAAHIGDSRIYHIRPKTGLLYQSRDHSLVFDLFQAGEITYEEMATYPQKNIVTRAMTPGEDNRMRPDIIHITDIQLGDYFYMCSDGMLEKMSNDELLTFFSSDLTDEEKQKYLIEATVTNQDNHTAWLIHIKDVVKEDRDENFENEEPTARCNALNIIPKVIEANQDDVVIVQKLKKDKTLLQRMKDVVDFIMNKKQ
jgi:protein phosphatase